MDKIKKVNKKIINIDTDSSFEIKEKETEKKQIKEPVKKKPNSIKDSDYVRPVLTYTDKLSKKDIETLLLDYEKVTDLNTVPTGTHIRYFEDKDGEMKFRMGGILTIKTGLPTYCILKSNQVSWSVQIAKCIFFRRISIKDIKEEYEKIIIEKDNKINELITLIREIKKKNKTILKK
jgi:hypothetical protein